MDIGRAVPDGLSSSTEPVSRLGPSGFDPSRFRFANESKPWTQRDTLTEHHEMQEEARRLWIYLDGCGWDDSGDADSSVTDMAIGYIEFLHEENDRLTAIAMEARQGRNREDGSDPKDDSAGPKDIAQGPSHEQ